MPVRVMQHGGMRGGGARYSQAAIIGVLSLLTAAYLLVNRNSTADQQQTVPQFVAEFDTVVLPVPDTVVPAGTRVKEIKFSSVRFPKQQVPAGALTDLLPLLDSVTVAPLPAHLPIFAENLSSPGILRNPVIEQIPAGMRAMTVRVEATTAVEGWAGSGALVDVLLVGKDRTIVIAERVKVLSAERSTTPIDESTSPSVPSTATLLVTQEQCLAINTAIPIGKIAFALRSFGDEQRWEGASFSSEKLKGSPASIRKPEISGALAIEEHGERRSFALADGKWVRITAPPPGFLIGKSEEH